MGKKKNIPTHLKDVVKGVLKNTTVGGGVNIGDDEFATVPSGSLSFGKGNKKANISLSKPYLKKSKQNINSTIGLGFTKENKNSSFSVEGSKTGKAKNLGISFSKTFNKGGASMLKGNQVKLDKDGDGKISGNDFKMMKPKKKSKGGQIKPVKAVAGVLAGLAAGVAPGIIGLGLMANKRAKKKAKATAEAQAEMASNGKIPIVSLYQKATEQKKARHGGYMKKANRGMMMEKPSTRGFGAARTSGMGLENESLQPGKIYDKVKAKKGKMAKAMDGEFITVSEYSEDLI